MMTKRKKIRLLEEEISDLKCNREKLLTKIRELKKLNDINYEGYVNALTDMQEENVELQKRLETWEEIKENEHFKAFPSRVKEKGRATIVWFPNGVKIVVKKAKGEHGDIYTAVAYAICEHIYGNNSQFKKYIDRKVEK